MILKFNMAARWQAWWQTARAARQQQRQLLSVLMAALLAFGLAAYFPLQEGYWIGISALLGLYFSMRLLMQRHLLLLFSAALVTGWLAFITSMLASYAFLLALFLLALTFTMLYWGLRYASVWAATFVAGFYAIISAGLSTTTEGSVQRFYCIVLGFGIAIFVQLLFTRSRLATELRFTLASSLLRLSKLNHAIFRCYVTHNYAEEHFNYEKKLHQCRTDFLYEMQHARVSLAQLKESKREPFFVFINYIEQLYEIMQSLSLLIYRVEDHATFAVAEKEFLALSEKIDQRLRQLAKTMTTQQVQSDSVNVLGETIYELEEINRTVLQVVAHDPLVFMIFIQDLYVFDKVCLQLSDAITAKDVK